MVTGVVATPNFVTNAESNGRIVIVSMQTRAECLREQKRLWTAMPESICRYKSVNAEFSRCSKS